MEVRYIISEEESQYMEIHKGYMSKRLAEWAISMMEKNDGPNGMMKKITPVSIDEIDETMKGVGIEIPEESRYDAWYLYNMSVADYPKSLKTKEDRANYVYETICDPDGDPRNVLACFRAKMDVKGIPIHWERFI